jgi:hypothetical protein
MMDFLRRLAPPRETDATRAFAVLPSRFASENPLQATMGQVRPAQRPDDDEASLSPDAALPPAANNTLAGQRPPVTSVQPSQAAPRPLANEPTRRDNEKASSPTHVPANEKATSPAYAPAEAPGIHVVNPRALQNRHGENPERARPASPEPESLAATPAATHSLQNVTAPPAQARVALPLSQAILAQRTLQSRDDSQVVHVTIGRIDVVANTAPAPAVRRSPAPRQGTVTLADYLRGSHGGRQ